MKKSRSLELAGASSNRWWLITLSGDPEVMGKKVFSPNSHSNRISKYLNTTFSSSVHSLVPKKAYKHWMLLFKEGQFSAPASLSLIPKIIGALTKDTK